MKSPLIYISLILLSFSCSKAEKTPSIKIEQVQLDENDSEYGSFFQIKPQGKINRCLVLLPGFGQEAQQVFEDTDFHSYTQDKNILLVSFAGKTRLTADSLLRMKLNSLFEFLLKKHEFERNQVVLGGFSAGGIIALRYAELCYQFPDEYPIKPAAVFMADSPIDLYTLARMQDKIIRENSSPIGVNEAQFLNDFYRKHYGYTPLEQEEIFRNLTPFSMDTTWGQNEVHLKDIAIRAYHDIDISWRLNQRGQSPQYNNFIPSAELILRLNRMGNDRAEFMQTFQTGYRTDGKRHPHSWSIIDEEECVDWLIHSLNKEE